MYPSIVQVVNQDQRIKDVLGSPATADSDAVVRFMAWGDAGQNPELPYATWQLVSGQPENYLGHRPDVDDYTLQVDVYAGDDNDVIKVYEALEAVIEEQLDLAYIDAWRSFDTDPDTGNRHIGFDVGWVQQRNFSIDEANPNAVSS